MQKLFDSLYRKFGSNFFLSSFVGLAMVSAYLFNLLIEAKQENLNIKDALIKEERECSERINKVQLEQIEYFKQKEKELNAFEREQRELLKKAETIKKNIQLSK